MRTCICRWFYYFFKICLRTSLSVIFQANVYVNNPKTLLGRKCRDHSGCARLTRFLVSEHICTFTQSHIFASQGLRFGSPLSPPLADLEYILRIRALIFHWLRLPVHVSNQKMFYTEHMLSTKCKQRCHFPFWFQWKYLSRLSKLWNFSLG